MRKHNHPKIVVVCAWCNPRSYKALKSGEAYSHGICLSHKEELLAGHKFASQ